MGRNKPSGHAWIIRELLLNSEAVSKGEKDERKTLWVACSVLGRGLDFWEVLRVIREL